MRLSLVIHRVGKEEFDIYVYVGLILFVAVQCSYCVIIWRLAKGKEYIERIVRSADFSKKFILRDQNVSTRNVVRETATALDWLVVTSILKETWLEFYVMGIPLHNGQFLKQVVALVGGAFFYVNFLS